jgi:hypothetical protein
MNHTESAISSPARLPGERVYLAVVIIRLFRTYPLPA